MGMRDFETIGSMLSLREAMNRLLEDSFVAGNGRGTVSSLHLSLDLYETPDALVARFSIPGIPPDEIDITLQGDALTVRGIMQPEPSNETVTYHLREHRAGAVSRSITLPVEVQVDQVQATVEHGVLTLTMPKAERARPKTIKISTRAATPAPSASTIEGQRVPLTRLAPSESDPS